MSLPLPPAEGDAALGLTANSGSLVRLTAADASFVVPGTKLPVVAVGIGAANCWYGWICTVSPVECGTVAGTLASMLTAAALTAAPSLS